MSGLTDVVARRATHNRYLVWAQAEDMYRLYAVAAGDATPWERLSQRQREAWREVALTLIRADCKQTVCMKCKVEMWEVELRGNFRKGDQRRENVS